MNEISKLQDLELISKSKEGSSDATEALIIRYKALVCKITRSSSYFLNSGGDAEDLIQEGTIGFLQAVRDFDPDKGVPFISFASTCIANKVRDAMRGFLRSKNEPLNDAISISETNSDGEPRLAELSAPEGSDPLSKYQDAEKTNDFYRILERIATPIQCSVLKMYLDGNSYKEISEKLGISTKTVDNTLAAVKNKIKKSKAEFE